MKGPTSKMLSITALILALFAICTSVVNARNYARLFYTNRYQDPVDLINVMMRGTPIQHHSRDHHQPIEKRTFNPQYTVSEDNGIVQLEMEVPGVQEKDIIIDLEDNVTLNIKGTRTYTKKSITDGSLEQAEFELSFRLNDNVDTNRLTASLSSGILRVQVPNKVKEVKRIPIDTTSTASTSDTPTTVERNNDRDKVVISLHVHKDNDDNNVSDLSPINSQQLVTEVTEGEEKEKVEGENLILLMDGETNQ